MSFWRLKGCGKGVRGVFIIEIGSVLAQKSKYKSGFQPHGINFDATFWSRNEAWHRFWCHRKLFLSNTHKSRASYSLLSERLQKFSSGRLNFSPFSWSTTWGRNYSSAAPIKSVLPNPPLLRGYIETGRSQKNFPGTLKKALSNGLTSGGVPQEYPIPSPDKEVITIQQLNSRHRNRYDRARIWARRRCGAAERSRGRHRKTPGFGRTALHPNK